MKQILVEQIEDVREQLCKTALQQGVLAPETIELSKRLDELINQYNECKTTDLLL